MHHRPVGARGGRRGGGGNVFGHFDDQAGRWHVHVLRTTSQEVRELIASVMPPGGAPGADARLERDTAIVTRAAGDVAPYDAVASLHGIAENISAVAVQRFDIPAWLMAGDDRQRISVAKRAVPAMNVGAAEC